MRTVRFTSDDHGKLDPTPCSVASLDGGTFDTIRNICAVVSNSNRSCDDWTWDDILGEVKGQSVERDWNF